MHCEDCEYQNMTEVIDGNVYINCRFQNCTIVYAGGEIPVIQGGSFDNCAWRFEGAASRTLEFMSQLYNAGGKPFIEECFDHIRLGV